MKKILGLMAIAAMMVGMLAGPASAGAGVFAGNAQVSQGSAPCGTGSPGLGLPALNQNKNGSYRLVTAVTDVINGSGTLDICGKLTSVAGIGAACGMSKGYAGTGSIVGANGTASLTNVGWKFSVGGTLPIIGNVSGAKNGKLYSIAQAQGALPCLDKAAQNFTVVGVFVVTPAGPKWNDITDVADPKNDGPSSPTNPWGNKK